MKTVNCLNWVERERNHKYGKDVNHYFKTMNDAINKAAELELNINSYCDVIEVRSNGHINFFIDWRKLV